MGSLFKMVNVLSKPLMYLNIFGGIIAGVWLVALGEWSIVLLAIGSSFVTPKILAILMLIPAIVIGLPASGAANTKILKFLTIPLVILGGILNVSIMCGWSLLVFSIILNVPTVIYPLLLLAYSVSTIPFAFLASIENTNFADIYVLFHEFANLILMISLILFPINTINGMGLLFVSMFIPLVIITINIVRESTQEEKINEYISNKTSEIKITKSENTFNIIEPTLNEIERVNIALSLIAYFGYIVDVSVEPNEENSTPVSSARAMYISTISFMNLLHEIKSFPSREEYVSYIFEYSINKSIHNIKCNGSLTGQIECGFKYLDNVFRSVSDSYKVMIDLCISEFSLNRDKFNNKKYSIGDVELFALATIDKVMRTVDEGPQVSYEAYIKFLDGYRENMNSSQVPVI